MLPGRRVHPTLPTSDLERSRAFYENVLGFTPWDVSPGGVTYEAGEGTRFFVFPSAGRAAGTHTQMGFTVPDIEAEVRERLAETARREHPDWSRERIEMLVYLRNPSEREAERIAVERVTGYRSDIEFGSWDRFVPIHELAYYVTP